MISLIMIGVAFLFQLRSLLCSYIDINVMFEFMSLLHLILTEQNKEIGYILYLAALADSTVKAKRRLILQEKIIRYF